MLPKSKIVLVDEENELVNDTVQSATIDDTVLESENKKKRKFHLHWFTKILLFVDACAVFCFIMAYADFGFCQTFQDWLVTTALCTGKHKYFAYVLYDDNMVKKVSSRNVMVAPSGVSDPSLIEFVDYSNVEINYENPYERQILEKDEGNDDYKIFEIRENGYAGLIAVIYHPENLELATAYRKYGDFVSTMVKGEGAVLGTNCSGFLWDSSTHYMVPCTNMIKNGEIYYEVGGTQPLIGMNKDGVLMLNYCTAQEALDLGYEWGVQFGPFLIVNGEAAQFQGNGGWGIEPRTAIGQRKDGIVILIVIDGRGKNGSLGAGLDDILDICLRYGCYNAANLDGGGSSVMVEKGNIISHPCDDDFAERLNVSALVYKASE